MINNKLIHAIQKMATFYDRTTFRLPRATSGMEVTIWTKLYVPYVKTMDYHRLLKFMSLGLNEVARLTPREWRN
jgi:hypothetical protein